MRNYFAIAFTCVYLILTVGVAKTTHYCMGRFSHSALYSFESRKCPCYRVQKATVPCCKDEHQLITIDNDQSQAQVIAVHAPVFFEIGPLFTESLVSSEDLVAASAIEFYSDNSPPPKPCLFKLHCSFVFYG